MKTKVRGREEK